MIRRLWAFLLAALFTLLSLAAPVQADSTRTAAAVNHSAFALPHAKDIYLPWQQAQAPPLQLAGINLDGNIRDLQGIAALGTALPSFSLPLNDLGNGAVNLVPLIAYGSPTPTFTRATTAWTKLSTGLWASVASGTARYSYLGANTVIGAAGGYLAEGARTNYALYSRGWTNAAWVASNVTVAQTQTGVDGVANSAASLTASAGNGTLLQSITLASQANVFQPFVKRITGTGEVDITLDGGTTWTNITSQINSSTFTQVQATKTAANPQIGFRLVTSGDAIAVDMGDMQNGTFASTPIPTQTVAVTRNADILTYPSAGNVNSTIGSVYGELWTEWVTSDSSVNMIGVGFINGSSTGLLTVISNASTILVASDGTNQTYKSGLTSMHSAVSKSIASWSGSTMLVTAQGLAVATGTFDGDMNASGVYVGNIPFGTRPWFGTIRGVKIYPTALSAAQLQAMTQ